MAAAECEIFIELDLNRRQFVPASRGAQRALEKLQAGEDAQIAIENGERASVIEMRQTVERDVFGYEVTIDRKVVIGIARTAESEKIAQAIADGEPYSVEHYGQRYPILAMWSRA